MALKGFYSASRKSTSIFCISKVLMLLYNIQIFITFVANFRV